MSIQVIECQPVRPLVLSNVTVGVFNTMKIKAIPGFEAVWQHRANNLDWNARTYLKF